MSFHGLIAFFCLFLRWSDIPLFGCNSLFIHSPTKGHLGCFQVLVIMSKVVTNIHMQVFNVDMFLTPLGKYQGMRC